MRTHLAGDVCAEADVSNVGGTTKRLCQPFRPQWAKGFFVGFGPRFWRKVAPVCGVPSLFSTGKEHRSAGSPPAAPPRGGSTLGDGHGRTEMSAPPGTVLPPAGARCAPRRFGSVASFPPRERLVPSMHANTSSDRPIRLYCLGYSR